MTPEELGRIEKEINFYDTFNPNDFKEVVAEVRRLWAERDARLLVGRPVSEERLEEIRSSDAEVKAEWMYSEGTNSLCPERRDLLQHIAFLERLLADADDLPQVRRTGYADGWRAAIDAAVAHFEKLGTDAPNKHYDQWLKSYGQLVTGSLRELEP